MVFPFRPKAPQFPLVYLIIKNILSWTRFVVYTLIRCNNENAVTDESRKFKENNVYNAIYSYTQPYKKRADV